jgi:hypothetical protein
MGGTTPKHPTLLPSHLNDVDLKTTRSLRRVVEWFRRALRPSLNRGARSSLPHLYGLRLILCGYGPNWAAERGYPRARRLRLLFQPDRTDRSVQKAARDRVRPDAQSLENYLILQ